MTTIILLNGVGSVGKSSLAKALQSITRQPFLHIEMDGFLKMMPEKYLDHPDGLSFETQATPEGPETLASCGSVASAVLNGMRRATAAMASSGNNLIIDEVIFGDRPNDTSNPMVEYRRLLAPHTFHVVGVHAELEVLEQRERDRGDRVLGLSRWQYNHVHEGMNYDFVVHTDRSSPLKCAEHIKAKFGL